MSGLGLAVVIEDDLDVRNLVEGVLLQSGFEVRSASGGREGVDLVREIGPDVVTLDVGLPDIDGFEVLRRIRQLSNAYVVMLTGREEETDLLAGLQGGADDYITKPFRLGELRARIAAMMRRPRPQSPDGSRAAPAAEAAPGHNGNGGSSLRYNGLDLDHRKRTVSVNGRPWS